MSYGTSSRRKATGRMSESSMLRELLVDQMRDIYWAEKHLLKGLTKMAKAATTEDLRMAFEKHWDETEEQVRKLEQAFELLGENARGKKCDAMEGLVEEAKIMIEETEDGSLTRDAGLILAAQKVEHYEIATYGTLVQFARTLGESEVVMLMEEILEQEKATDQTLTSLAEGSINEEALMETEATMEEEEEWMDEVDDARDELEIEDVDYEVLDEEEEDVQTGHGNRRNNSADSGKNTRDREKSAGKNSSNANNGKK